MDDGIKFLAAVQKGEVKTEKFEMTDEDIEIWKNRHKEDLEEDESDKN